MNLERALDEIVFNLWHLCNNDLVCYIDEKNNMHKVVINEIDEEENNEYNVSICETLLRITIDNSDNYLVQVANRLYINEDDYYNSECWREY